MSSTPNKPEYTFSRIEKVYLTQRRRNIYTALEDLNFHWDENEIRLFEQLLEEGKSPRDICQLFKRDPYELLVLAIDRSLKGKIKRKVIIEFGKGGCPNWQK